MWTKTIRSWKAKSICCHRKFFTISSLSNGTFYLTSTIWSISNLISPSSILGSLQKSGKWFVKSSRIPYWTLKTCKDGKICACSAITSRMYICILIMRTKLSKNLQTTKKFRMKKWKKCSGNGFWPASKTQNAPLFSGHWPTGRCKKWFLPSYRSYNCWERNFWIIKGKILTS